MSTVTSSKEKTGLNPKKQTRPLATLRKVARNWELYLFLLPTLVYFLIFKYYPMYGLQIAFKDFMAVHGILGSPWVGFEHFIRFFESYQFWNLLGNSLLINFYQLIFAFPIPIIFALMLNQVTRTRFKKVVQTVTYAPHFISVVVLVGMLFIFLSPSNGFVNNIIQLFGGEPIYFMGSEAWFKPVFVGSQIWQTTGWSAIIYLAALTSVDPQLHEAAIVDGATKLQRVFHIDIPGILPVIMIMLILEIGNFVTLGYQKVLLMQNELNIASSEVIQTYVYKSGLLNSQFSYAAAIGLFENVINFILLIMMNQMAKKFKQQSLF
ncbi:sugar ABC transporter permease [Bacillaceae bacterium SIJ1]|uniref:ABC transporter permease n=1 Tax=Litoribacterium kuwaitense TaxID=1398745 RepID=UPI0013EA23DA|nr:ABC transporter permease subunit [Litoribacterium kuwaitense]NGP43826.1 sugar ABC transporter permease [Litoribacterium kuwaitense]